MPQMGVLATDTCCEGQREERFMSRTLRLESDDGFLFFYCGTRLVCSQLRSVENRVLLNDETSEHGEAFSYCPVSTSSDANVVQN